MEDDEVRVYLIRATEEKNDEGAPLWWSNEGGWWDLGDAVVFMPDEVHTARLPLGGEWVEFTNKVR